MVVQTSGWPDDFADQSASAQRWGRIPGNQRAGRPALRKSEFISRLYLAHKWQAWWIIHFRAGEFAATPTQTLAGSDSAEIPPEVWDCFEWRVGIP
jgi:hypothetical protein